MDGVKTGVKRQLNENEETKMSENGWHNELVASNVSDDNIEDEPPQKRRKLLASCKSVDNSKKMNDLSVVTDKNDENENENKNENGNENENEEEEDDDVIGETKTKSKSKSKEKSNKTSNDGNDGNDGNEARKTNDLPKERYNVEYHNWLKNNGISSLGHKLKDEKIETLDDINAIDSMQDLDELIKGMDLKVVERSKLKRAMLKVVQFVTRLSNNENDNGNGNEKNGKSVRYVLPKWKKSKNEKMERMKRMENGERKMEEAKNVEIGPNPNEEMPSMIIDDNGRRRINYHQRNKMTGLHQAPFYDSRNDVSKRNRTILVVGATGTGKTTAINSMMNYLWNVDYNDKFRYKLIVENSNKTQAHSMTQKVTSYYLEPPKLNYSLCIVDTPGFGDTAGVSKDDEIVKQIKSFFTDTIQEIDAICFAVRAPQARLTAEQKYVFNRVLGLFGKDIVSNIFILINFCDAKKPPVLDALEADNIPNDKYFKLNNSAFDLHESADEEEMGLLFWKLGMLSIDKLFIELGKVETKSLALTKAVLKRREELEARIEGVDPLIRKGFTVLQQMRDNMDAINANEKLVNANKDFEIVNWIDEAIQVPTTNNTTTCLNCPGNYTCHRDCVYSDDGDKASCCAMDSDGNCQVCPNKCHWTQHKNLPYVLEYEKKKVVKTVQELKDKYCDAQSKVSVADQIIAGLTGDLESIQWDVNNLINDVRACVNELRKIALRPNVLSQDDYIDQMIANEESQAKQGWKERVQALKALKTKQARLKEIHDNNYKPWEKYTDVGKYLQQKNSGVISTVFSWFSNGN